MKVETLQLDNKKLSCKTQLYYNKYHQNITYTAHFSIF